MLWNFFLFIMSNNVSLVSSMSLFISIPVPVYYNYTVIKYMYKGTRLTC